MDSQMPRGGGAGGAKPPHLSNPFERAALHERVKQQFGAFGSMAEEEGGEVAVDERTLLADDFLKPTIRLIAGVFLASLFAYFAASPAFDAPGVWANVPRFDTALVVVWGPLLIWAMSKLKLQKAVRIYLVLALFIEPFSEVMLKQQNEGYWDTVLWPAAVAFYGTIKEWSGLPGASLPVFFFVTIGLLYRATVGKRAGEIVPPPKFARDALLVFLGAVVALSLYGLVRGNFESHVVEGIVRQIVHLLQLPLIALVFLYVLRVPEDLPAIGTIYVVTALARSLLVAYVYFGVCMPQGITERPGLPEWCTTHSDSVLFVTAILIVVTHAFEQRTTRAIWRAVAVSAVIMVAIVLNNRRLAFVSLSIAPAAVYLALKPSKRKRRVTTALAIVVPLLIGYVLVGSELAVNSTSSLLKPAKLVMSVLDQKDLSSLSRDIENENLIYTLKQSPFFSTGFGFDYQNSPNTPPVDLSQVFTNFRLIAHNGVLWIWSLGGLVGFTVLWMIFPIAGTLAMRGYRSATMGIERSAALTALGVVGICIVQVWGDQGFNGYITPVTFAVAFAVATRLATRTS
jgi:hypothetical protein